MKTSNKIATTFIFLCFLLLYISVYSLIGNLDTKERVKNEISGNFKHIRIKNGSGSSYINGNLRYAVIELKEGDLNLMQWSDITHGNIRKKTIKNDTLYLEFKEMHHLRGTGSLNKGFLNRMEPNVKIICENLKSVTLSNSQTYLIMSKAENIDIQLLGNSKMTYFYASEKSMDSLNVKLYDTSSFIAPSRKTKAAISININNLTVVAKDSSYANLSGITAVNSVIEIKDHAEIRSKKELLASVTK